VQLLVLAVTIFGTKQLLLKNASKSESNSITPSDRPQVETSAVSAEDNAVSELRGMYRGAPWMSDKTKTPAPHPNPANLKYRGASIVPGKNREQEAEES
jgi:hypothetical protein